MTVGGRIVLIFFIFCACAGSAAIDEAKAISIGGIKQWVRLQGANEKNPILLFLHGGPGSSAMSYGDQFTGELKKHFVVVQWDQRETGKTKSFNSSPVPLTVALFESDALEVINYLRNRFAVDKIYLMGHSWGGFLGMMMADKHPELLSAYFAVSPMVNQAESERQSLAIMMAKAKASANAEELNELSQIQIPFKNGTQLYYHRKWLAKLMGQKMFAQKFVESWAQRWLPLFNEGSAVNCTETIPEIKCPIYFLLGDKDYQTYFRIAEDYYNHLAAPAKGLYWFKGSAHVFLSSEQKKIQEIILQQLLSGSSN